MAPRQRTRTGLCFLIGSPLDETPAEIATGVFLPFTRYEGTTYVDKFEVKFTVRIVKRQPICESIAVRSMDGSPVTAVTLRDIPVSAMVRESIDKLGQPFRIQGDKRVRIATQQAVDARAVER